MDHDPNAFALRFPEVAEYIKRGETLGLHSIDEATDEVGPVFYARVESITDIRNGAGLLVGLKAEFDNRELAEQVRRELIKCIEANDCLLHIVPRVTLEPPAVLQVLSRVGAHDFVIVEIGDATNGRAVDPKFTIQFEVEVILG